MQIASCLLGKNKCVSSLSSRPHLSRKGPSFRTTQRIEAGCHGSGRKVASLTERPESDHFSRHREADSLCSKDALTRMSQSVANKRLSYFTSLSLLNLVSKQRGPFRDGVGMPAAPAPYVINGRGWLVATSYAIYA